MPASIPKRAKERATQALADVGLGDRIHHKPNELPAVNASASPSRARWSTNRRSFWPTSRPEISIPKPAKKSWRCSRIYIRRGNTIILVTHERDIAAHARRTVHLRDGSIEMRSRGIYSRARSAGGRVIRHEAVSLRAERKLENRGRANAIEHDAFNAHRARRHHRHRRRDVDGHRDERDIHRVSIKACPCSATTFSTSRNGHGSRVDDWWNYRDRKKIKTEYAETLNRMIAATPNSNLVVAVPTSNFMRSVKYGGNQVDNVFVLGTTSDFIVTSTIDCTEGRFFNELESRGGANVVVIGYDVADALFPSESPIDKSVLINGQLFKVIGVNTRQGTFLGLFSLDSMVAMPLGAFNKYFSRQERIGCARESERQNQTRRGEG